MDKASDFESEDCGFKSHGGCLRNNYILLQFIKSCKYGATALFIIT